MSMKYKLEMWRFSAFEYEEAEEHLNQMAAKGWALRNITKAWMPIACYEKREDAAAYRYTAEALPNEENQDFLTLCSDAGWERIVPMQGNLWIFRTKDSRANPLFTDLKSRRAAAWQTLYHSGRAHLECFGAILCIVVGVYFVLKVKTPGSEWYFKMMGCLFIGLGICKALMSSANFIWLKKSGAEGAGYIDEGRPRWVERLSDAGHYSEYICIFGILAARMFYYGILGSAVGMISIALCPIFYMTGVFIRLFIGKELAGFGMMLLGVWLFIVDLSSFS